MESNAVKTNGHSKLRRLQRHYFMIALISVLAVASTWAVLLHRAVRVNEVVIVLPNAFRGCIEIRQIRSQTGERTQFAIAEGAKLRINIGCDGVGYIDDVALAPWVEYKAEHQDGTQMSTLVGSDDLGLGLRPLLVTADGSLWFVIGTYEDERLAWAHLDQLRPAWIPSKR